MSCLKCEMILPGLNQENSKRCADMCSALPLAQNPPGLKVTKINLYDHDVFQMGRGKAMLIKFPIQGFSHPGYMVCRGCTQVDVVFELYRYKSQGNYSEPKVQNF